MTVGTKSVLFGVHQCVWHPITVVLAWRSLYGSWPTWRQMVCIALHDLGYWGCRDMDGVEGRKHPLWGADLARRLFSIPRLGGSQGLALKVWWFCVCHSRHTADILCLEPSALCWADKGSIMWEPEWFYLFRARLSGEIHEYKRNAVTAGHLNPGATDRGWFMWYKHRTLVTALIEADGIASK